MENRQKNTIGNTIISTIPASYCVAFGNFFSSSLFKLIENKTKQAKQINSNILFIFIFYNF